MNCFPYAHTLCLGDMERSERIPAGREWKKANVIWLQRYRLPAELPFFRGHFPGNPVLPALTQIMFARHSAERLSKARQFLAAIVQAKFTAPVRPESILTVHLSAVENDWLFRLTVQPADSDQPTDASSLRLRFLQIDKTEIK